MARAVISGRTARLTKNRFLGSGATDGVTTRSWSAMIFFRTAR